MTTAASMLFSWDDVERLGDLKRPPRAGNASKGSSAGPAESSSRLTAASARARTIPAPFLPGQGPGGPRQGPYPRPTKGRSAFNPQAEDPRARPMLPKNPTAQAPHKAFFCFRSILPVRWVAIAN